MNIVIADDEEIILKWMKKNIEALSPEHHVIEACINGMQVLNCCLNHQVDVLFTDIRMPIMDGMELLKKLNQNHVLPYTVVLSAYDDFSYARDCLKLGVSEFLLKSEITKDELEVCLQSLDLQGVLFFLFYLQLLHQIFNVVQHIIKIVTDFMELYFIVILDSCL